MPYTSDENFLLKQAIQNFVGSQLRQVADLCLDHFCLQEQQPGIDLPRRHGFCIFQVLLGGPQSLLSHLQCILQYDQEIWQS